MKTILYEPIAKNNKKECFSVNGALLSDLDEAIRLTKQHTDFRNGQAKIIRVDVYEYCDIIDNSKFVKSIYY